MQLWYTGFYFLFHPEKTWLSSIGWMYLSNNEEDLILAFVYARLPTIYKVGPLNRYHTQCFFLSFFLYFLIRKDSLLQKNPTEYIYFLGHHEDKKKQWKLLRFILSCLQ